jgi:hypothetical protein
MRHDSNGWIHVGMEVAANGRVVELQRRSNGFVVAACLY